MENSFTKGKPLPIIRREETRSKTQWYSPRGVNKAQHLQKIFEQEKKDDKLRKHTIYELCKYNRKRKQKQRLDVEKQAAAARESVLGSPNNYSPRPHFYPSLRGEQFGGPRTTNKSARIADIPTLRSGSLDILGPPSYSPRKEGGYTKSLVITAAVCGSMAWWWGGRHANIGGTRTDTAPYASTVQLNAIQETIYRKGPIWFG